MKKGAVSADHMATFKHAGGPTSQHISRKYHDQDPFKSYGLPQTRLSARGIDFTYVFQRSQTTIDSFGFETQGRASSVHCVAHRASSFDLAGPVRSSSSLSNIIGPAQARQFQSVIGDSR